MMYGTRNPGALGISDASVLKLFRTGNLKTGRRPDTMDLARIYGVHESLIANAISRAKDAERDEADDWNKSRPKPQGPRP